jgi:uncharacterized protein YegJ (DUF2314 family)
MNASDRIGWIAVVGLMIGVIGYYGKDYFVAPVQAQAISQPPVRTDLPKPAYGSSACSGKGGSMYTPIVFVARNDPEMLEATQKARKSFSFFKDTLDHPKIGQSDFAIKADIAPESHDEFAWLTHLKTDGTTWRGKEVDSGDVYEVSRKDIIDWMFIESGLLQGGYTTRVLRCKLFEKDRKLFDADQPYVIN